MCAASVCLASDAAYYPAHVAHAFGGRRWLHSSLDALRADTRAMHYIHALEFSMSRFPAQHMLCDEGINLRTLVF